MKSIVIIILLGLIGIIRVSAQNQTRITIDKDIQLIHLQDSVYVHVTWHYLEGFGRFTSNGMILIKNGQALMIDTPMDNDKTERLTRYLKDTFSVVVKKLIIGHFHDDCLGGLGYLQSIGIESIANSRTIKKCREIGIPVPSISFTDSLNFNFNGEQIECRFLGAGHSFDNITVWLPGKKILFGGCLVKAENSKELGNLSDAVIEDWGLTIKKLMNQYKNIKMVIPGHGDVGGPNLLIHTINLVEDVK